MNHRDKRSLIDELGNWQGIKDYRFETGGKHRKFVVETSTGSRFITMSVSPSDKRAERNRITDLRKILRELGAEMRRGAKP
ncbi:MAG: hypothetical protein ACRCVX_09215 [Shewanella sp.]